MAGQQTRQQEYFQVRPTQKLINIKVSLLAAEEIGDHVSVFQVETSIGSAWTVVLVLVPPSPRR